jgi:transcriptional regulator with XRE-family HTH domain
MDYKILFGTNVRRLRKSLGYSQENLAHTCGLDRTYIGGIERGERNVSIDNIAKLANALQVPLGHLFESEGNLPHGK